MRTIYKYRIVPDDAHTLRLPIGAEFLSIQEQHGSPQAWFLIDPDEKVSVKRFFRVYGTGHDMPDDPGKYLGTFQLHGGSLVFHLFEES